MLVSASPSEHQQILAYWNGRFGVPFTALEGLRFLVRGKNVWVMSDIAGVEEILSSLKVEAAGLPFLRKRRGGWKPTTAALLLLDNAVTKNILDLAREQLDPFLGGETLSGPFPLEGGYVAVRCGGRMLGCALHGKAGLKSQLPRAWVDALAKQSPESVEEA